MGRPKRNILAAAEESLTPPDELAQHQSVARVGKAEGNSMYTCTLPNKKPVLVELPTRFRNTIWIKRGGFVLVDLTPSEEQQKANSKYDGEIINVVRDEKAWRKQAYWYVLASCLYYLSRSFPIRELFLLVFVPRCKPWSQWLVSC